MRRNMQRMPRFETLESMTLLSSVAAAVHFETAHIAKAATRSIEVGGEVQGYYSSISITSVAPTIYALAAHGTITPIGPATVTGSFHTARGHLIIVGTGGSLNLKLTKAPSTSASDSPDDASNGPIILVYDFTYKITAGTGQYKHDRGTGKVVITTTPGLVSPTGPGIYSGPTTTNVGRTTLTFNPTPVAAG